MRWVTFCRVFFISEAVLAASINFLVLIVAWNRRMDEHARTYRIGITVMSVSAIVQALLQCLTVTIHQIHDNVYTLVQLGATEWMSESAREICTIATQAMIFLLWEWIPASCILQYLALSRPHYSTTRRLFIAYAYCLLCIGVCSPFAATFINEKTWTPYVQKAVRSEQGIEPDESVFGYAATTNVVSENNNRTIRPFVFIAMVSYTWSYGAIVLTTVLIFQTLRADGAKLTKATLALQRRFWKMIVLQGFVPLGVCGFPVMLFFYNIIAGTSMDRSTVIMTAGVYAVPTVQGLVSLSFVRPPKKKVGFVQDTSHSHTNASTNATN